MAQKSSTYTDASTIFLAAAAGGSLVAASTTIILSLVLGALAVWLVSRRFVRSKGRLPPGPLGIPLFGVLHQLGKHPQVTIADMAKKYNSNVISMYLGPQLAVILNDYEAIKAAYIDQTEVFSGRPQNFILKYASRGSNGIIITEGPFWREQRRFLLRSFHDLGVGKSRFEELCIEESQVLVQAMLAHGLNGFNPRQEIDSSVANIICALVFAKRFERRDPILRQFLDNQTKLTRFSGMNPVQVLPFLRHLPPFRQPWKEFQSTVEQLHGIIEPEVRCVEEKYDASQEPTCITEFFLQRRAKEFGTGPAAEAAAERDRMWTKTISYMFSVFQNQVVFSAGTETSVNTLNWCILFFLLYPEQQERCYAEILNHVDTDRPVSWDDRTSLPYVEAFLLEVWRRANILPLSVVRRNTEDAYLNGYFIPKHTMILPNLWNVHRSKQYWADPLKFEPNRFLEEKAGDGVKILRVAWHIPFSTGKRQCTGEGIARMEIFLLLANLVQKLEFTRAEEDKLDGDLPSENNVSPGAIVQPARSFKVCVRTR